MKDTAMARITQETHIELSRRESITLGNLRGHIVECVTGELWLTVDGEGWDVILGPGCRHTVQSDAPAVISALRPSALHLSAVPPPPSRLQRFRTAIAALLHPASPYPSIR